MTKLYTLISPISEKELFVEEELTAEQVQAGACSNILTLKRLARMRPGEMFETKSGGMDQVVICTHDGSED